MTSRSVSVRAWRCKTKLPPLDHRRVCEAARVGHTQITDVFTRSNRAAIRVLQWQANGLPSCSPRVPSLGERSLGHESAPTARQITNRNAVPSPASPRLQRLITQNSPERGLPVRSSRASTQALSPPHHGHCFDGVLRIENPRSVQTFATEVTENHREKPPLSSSVPLRALGGEKNPPGPVRRMERDRAVFQFNRDPSNAISCCADDAFSSGASGSCVFSFSCGAF